MRKSKKRVKQSMIVCAMGLFLLGGVPVHATEYEAQFAGQIQENEEKSEGELPILTAKDDIASGKTYGCQWVIDHNGTLTVRSMNDMSKLITSDWQDYKDKIKKVDIDVPYCGKLNDLFKEYPVLEEAKVKIDVVGERYHNTALFWAGYMFAYCPKLKKVELEGFENTSLIDYGDMFSGCSELEEVNLDRMKSNSIWYISGIVQGCTSLKTFRFGGLDLGDTFGWRYAFNGCRNLEKLDLSSYDLTDMRELEYTFKGCKNLTELKFPKEIVIKIQKIGAAFSDCSSLKTLDLSNFDMTKLKEGDSSAYTLDKTFSGCTALEEIQAPLHLSLDIPLPEGKWYRDDTGEQITSLPKELEKSITVHRQEEGNPFMDVRLSAWQYDGAKYVYDNGIMTGKETKDNGQIYFDVTSPMTRAEFVQTLYNYQGIPAVKYSEVFTDVGKNKWYTNAILWAKENDIVAGKGKIFDVDGKVTRQEMATMLYNFAKYRKFNVKNSGKLTGFADHTTVDSWAVDAMKWAVAKKIINGKPGKTQGQMLLDPKGFATRGEGATILKNFMQKYKK